MQSAGRAAWRVRAAASRARAACVRNTRGRLPHAARQDGQDPAPPTFAHSREESRRQLDRRGSQELGHKIAGKLGIALGPAVIEQIHQRIVAIAQEQPFHVLKEKARKTKLEAETNFRTEGKKTLGLEMAEPQGERLVDRTWSLPDVIVYPTGGGTGLTYQPNATRTQTKNDISISYSDNAAPANLVTRQWSFTTVVNTAGTPSVVRGQWDFDAGNLAATIGRATKSSSRRGPARSRRGIRRRRSWRRG